MLKQASNLIAWVVSGVLLFGAFGIVVFATPLFGNRALIVRSGSMEPAISVGDIVIVRPGNYQVGDAIAYNVPGRQGMVVTHRISEIKDEQYITKGDANPEVDSWVVTQGDIIGKELFTIPWLGTLLAFAKSRIGFMSLVVAPALIVILSEARVIWREMRRKPYLTPAFANAVPSPYQGEGNFSLFVSPPVRKFVDSISAVAVVLMIAVMTPATFALYTDTGTISNNVFTAADDFGFGTDHIVISEVQIIGDNANEDFIELYNPTDSLVNLGGWKLQKKTSGGTIESVKTIDSGETIAAHGFYLWASSKSNGYETSVDADQTTQQTLSENNSVALRKPDDTIVDQVGWGNVTDPFVEGTLISINIGNNESYERKANSSSDSTSMAVGGADEFGGNSFDSDDNASDFAKRNLAQPQNSSSDTEL